MEFRSDAQRTRASLEDALVDFVYKNFNDFVMHGGTAVWRCYGGNRFSRDLDFYTNMNAGKESEFQKNVHALLTKGGYPIVEEGYNNKTLMLHVTVRGYGSTGKFDFTFAHAKGEATEYSRVDGTKRIIYALPAEGIFMEKIETYSDKLRRGTAEMQDIYDILLLKDRLKNPSLKTLGALKEFLDRVKDAPPENEKELANLILSGVPVSFADTVNLLEGWLDDNTK